MATDDDMQLNKFNPYLESWCPIKDLDKLDIEVAHSPEDTVLSQ